MEFGNDMPYCVIGGIECEVLSIECHAVYPGDTPKATVEVQLIGKEKPKEKEKPMDRTEEDKALHEFVASRNLGKNWLAKTVKKLKRGETMFANLTENQQALFESLFPFSVIEFADCDCNPDIMWKSKGQATDHFFASKTYRLLPSYTLPLLETPPRFKEGTWIAILDLRSDRQNVREIAARELYPGFQSNALPDWCAVQQENGQYGWVGQKRPDGESWQHIQELPPMPDKARLAEQGYELTMEVADCSVEGHGHLWASHNLFDVYDRKSGYGVFNGWRWLVRKIEKKEEDEAGVEIAITDGKIASITIHDAGSSVCGQPDGGARIVSNGPTIITITNDSKETL